MTEIDRRGFEDLECCQLGLQVFRGRQEGKEEHDERLIKEERPIYTAGDLAHE